jgi:type II secretory pathway pseudopilin PulG
MRANGAGARNAGFTLLETMVAGTIMALFLGTLFALNSTSMQTLHAAREFTCTSQVLQQRIEAMRIANWHQVTDADWLRNNLLNSDAAGASLLTSVTETLTLVPYGSGSTGNTQITRSNGNASIVNRNSQLLAESAVKVIWSVSYIGAPNGKAYSRQIVAILAKGGVAK